MKSKLDLRVRGDVKTTWNETIPQFPPLTVNSTPLSQNTRSDQQADAHFALTSFSPSD